MTDHNQDDSEQTPKPGAIDWEDELQAWEKELNDAESLVPTQRRPTHQVPPLTNPPQPFYRPPSPQDFASEEEADQAEAFEDDFEPEERTRIEMVPKELLALLAKDFNESDSRTTKPPPDKRESKRISNGGIDSILDNLDEEVAREQSQRPPRDSTRPTPMKPQKQAALDLDDEDYADVNVAQVEITDQDDEEFEDVPPTRITRPQSDEGAMVARRMVQHKKKREEHFPLVGNSTETTRARRDFLLSLTQKATGAAKTRLFVAAAELSERLNELEEVKHLYAAAAAADTRDPVVIRTLRKEAIARGAWDEVARLLELESTLGLAAQDRTAVLTALAEIQLRFLNDPGGAERSARSALGIARGCMSAALLLAESCLHQDRYAEAITALEKAADHWADPSVKASIYGEMARIAERVGHTRRAQQCYAKSVETDTRVLESLLGLARVSRSLGEVDVALDALSKATRLLEAPSAIEALQRIGARWLHMLGNRPLEAAKLLEDAKSVASLVARVDAASDAQDSQTLLASLEALALASGLTKRAQTLVALAELKEELGDADGAYQALRDASLADGSLTTIRVVREKVARKFGEPPKTIEGPVDAGERTESSLVIAARSATSMGGKLEREREHLVQAFEKGESQLCTHVIILDAAASDNDLDAVRIELRRQADRLAPNQRVTPLLLLSELAKQSEELDAAEALLHEARELAPENTIALESLAHCLAKKAPHEAGNLWLDECLLASHARAAFAATNAGRLLESNPREAFSAYERAFEAIPSYPPAIWGMEPLARSQHHYQTLQRLHEHSAEVTPDPMEAASHWIRAAALCPAHDAVTAASFIENARSRTPQDLLIYELLWRLSVGATPEERVQMLEASASHAPTDLERSVFLRTAAAFEDAGEHARASEIYRKVLASDAHDPLASAAIDRAELAAGEHARVAERRFEAVRRAQTDSERVSTLEALAELDFEQRQDPASAVLSLQSILESTPTHLPSLRRLERYYMEHVRKEDLAVVEEQLVEHLGHGKDRIAHLRLATRLKQPPSRELDELILTAFDRVPPGSWISRQVEGAAASIKDLRKWALALEQQAEATSHPYEKVALALRAAEVLRHAGHFADALEKLEASTLNAAEHPAATEQLAELYTLVQRKEDAAKAYELAAQAAGVPRHATSLWYKAGTLWQELGETKLAIEAFQAAADRDVTYADVFPRLRTILSESSDHLALLNLIRNRLAFENEPNVLVGLYLEKSKLSDLIGEHEEAKEAIRAALNVEPENADALKKLSELCIQSEDWRGAAEALIRLARLRIDHDEQRWVFFMLGDIYDRYMPDARRAETAFHRALKLAPDDRETMSRLASLYQREGDVSKAAELLQDLVRQEADPERNRDHRIRLAEIIEQGGQVREAEGILEQLRKTRPTDIAVLRAMMQFYTRHDAHPALSMLLSRAINDLRNLVESNPGDAQTWTHLVEILIARNRQDPARCCASAAAAVHALDVRLAQVLDAQGGIPGAQNATAEAEIDDLVAPSMFSPAARMMFRLAEEAFQKVLPYDLKAVRAEKLSPMDPFVRAGATVAPWFGISSFQVMVANLSPSVCIPVSNDPVTILISRDLLGQATDFEKTFLIARAMKLAQGSLSIVLRSKPDELALAVSGLIRVYDPLYSPMSIDSQALATMSKRVGKNISRKARDPLAPLAIEVGGSPDFRIEGLRDAVIDFGNRVALLATGALPTAVSAILKASGTTAHSPDASVIQGNREAWSLVRFAISDSYFDARNRTRADRS